MGKLRPRVTKEEMDLLQSYRDSNKGISEECDAVGIDLKNVKNYWYKGVNYSINAKGADISNQYEEIRKEILGDMKAFAPKYPVIKRNKHKENHLLIVDPADPHFGKRSTIEETGEETNLITTEKRFSEGIEGLINKTDFYKFDKIIFSGGNDALHTDNPFGTTTAGTRQDTAGMWYENFLTAKRAYINGIDRLLTVADIHFVFSPSNHDFMTGFFLADTLKSWYQNNKNITFDVTPIHRKYVQYGYNLMGFTHADSAKEAALVDLIKTEAKKAWSESKYAYWFTHHIHHKDKKGFRNNEKVLLEKDYRNLTIFNTGLNLDPTDYCNVEYVRSISGTDRYHYSNGFIHAPCSMECFVHHPKWGQISKFNHFF